MILMMILMIRMITIQLLVLALWSWHLGPGSTLYPVPAAGYWAGRSVGWVATHPPRPTRQNENENKNENSRVRVPNPSL